MSYNVKKIGSLSVLMLALTGLQGCSDADVVAPSPLLQVSTLTVDAPLESEYRSFNGQVVAAELTSLSFRIEGEINQVAVQPGQLVKKGQVIATLDDEKAKQNLKDAKSQLNLASRQLKRGNDLYRNEMVSKAELDELTANYKLMSANLKAAEMAIKYTQLRAPFDGLVSDVPKDNFENTAAGEVVATLYKNDTVYVRIQISDSVLAMLNPEVNSESYQPSVRFSGVDQAYPMKYLEHTSELHPQSQTYEFWLQMPQVAPMIMPGTSATVTVDMMKAGLSTVQGYLLPMTALDAGREEGEFFVWKVVNGAVEKVQVGVEETTSQGVIVESGITQGDVLVTSNLRKLRQGMELKGAAQ